MARLKLATVWLGGCSGCHMSFLDMDEYLIELAHIAEIVFSPLVDSKEYPEGVDVVLVEGAVCNVEHLEMIRCVRRRSRILISFGDCAVTGNVSALRNVLGGALPVLERSYVERSDPPGAIPPSNDVLPRLLERVVPVHAVVKVDTFLPGCPPSGPMIRMALENVLAGERIDLMEHHLSFGRPGRPNQAEKPVSTPDSTPSHS